MYHQKYLKYKAKYLALKNIQKGGNHELVVFKNEFIAIFDPIYKISVEKISKIEKEGIDLIEKNKVAAEQSAILDGKTAKQITEAGIEAEKTEREKFNDRMIDSLKIEYSLALKYKEEHLEEIQKKIEEFAKTKKEQEDKIITDYEKNKEEAKKAAEESAISKGKTKDEATKEGEKAKNEFKKKILSEATGLSDREIAELAFGTSRRNKLDAELGKKSIEQIINDGYSITEILKDKAKYQPKYDLRNYYELKVDYFKNKLIDFYNKKYEESGKDKIETVINGGYDGRKFIHNNCFWISICCYLRTLPKYSNITIDDIKEVGELYHSLYDRQEFDNIYLNFRKAILKIVEEYNLEIRVYEVCNDSTHPFYRKITKPDNKNILEDFDIVTETIQPNFGTYNINYNPITNQIDGVLKLPDDIHIVNIAHYSGGMGHFELITKGYFFEDLTEKVDKIGRKKIIKYDMSK